MYSTIDTRVVELQFDNASFERNVKTSLDSLEKLNKSLELENAKKGASDLTNAYAGSGNSIATALSTVTTKFSVLEIAGKRVIENLVDSAVRASSRIVNEVIVKPVSQGFEKYGQKNSAIRTTLNSVKDRYETEEKAMESVSSVVEKLMWYSDETSYSFTEMLTNMSKFTSAGGDLEKSADVMIGISNAAALAGQNTQAAARVMYNMAQSYGAGAVKLIDWKSVENANVATEKLKQNIIDAAVALGTLKKDAKGNITSGKKVVTSANFNETLSTGWFTSSVMEKAFGEYAKFTDELYEKIEETGETASGLLMTITKVKEGTASAEEIKIVNGIIEDLGIEASETSSKVDILSNSIGVMAFKSAQEARTFRDAMDAVMDVVSTGWMEVMEQIFGDVDESAKIWTAFANEVSSAFYEIPGSLTAILKKWRELGGATSLMNSIANVWNTLKDIVTTVFEAFQNVFGSFDDFGTSLNKITRNVEKFTEALRPSPAILSVLKTVLEGVFTVCKVVIAAVKGLVSVMLPLTGIVWSSLDSLLGFASAFPKVFKSYIHNGLSTIVSSAQAMLKKIVSLLSSVKTVVFDFTAGIVSRAKDVFATGWTYARGVISKLASTVTNAVKPSIHFSEVWSKVFEKIQNAFQNLLSFAKTLPGRIVGFFSDLPNNVSKAFTAIAPKVKGAMDNVGNIVKDTFAKLRKSSADASSGTSGGIFDSILGGKDGKKSPLSFIDTFAKAAEKVASGTDGPLKGVIGFLQSIRNLIDLVKSILQDLHIIKPEPEKISSMQDFMTRIGTSLDEVDKLVAAKAKAVKANNFLKFSASILIIAIAVQKIKDSISELGEMDVATIAKGLGASLLIISSFGALVFALQKLNDQMGGAKINVALYLGISSLAGALVKTVSSFTELSKLDLRQILKGIVAVTGILAAISAVLIVSSRMAETQVGITIMPSAFGAISNAISAIGDTFVKLGEMSLKDIAKGSLAITAVMAAMSAAIIVTSKMAQVKMGITVMPESFSALANGVAKIGPVFVDLAKLTLAEVAKGGAALVAILASMSAAIILTSKFTKITLGIRAIPDSFKSIADSVVSIAPAFKDLASLSVGEIAKGGLALVAVLGTMSAAMAITSSFTQFSIGLFAMPRCFTALADAVTSVAPSFESLGSLSLTSIGKASLAMVAILGAMSTALVLTSNFTVSLLGIKTMNVAKAFEPIASSIVSVSDIFIKLSALRPDAILSGVVALNAIVSSIRGTVFRSSLMPMFTGKIDKIGATMGIVVSSMGDAAEAVLKLSKISSEEIKSGNDVIRVILSTLVDTIKSMATFKLAIIGGDTLKSIGESFKPLTSSIVDVAPTFIKLGSINVEQVKKGSDAIKAICDAMSDSISGVLSKTTLGLGFGIEKASLGFLNVAKAVTESYKAFTSLSRLSAKAIENGGEALRKIFTAMRDVLSGNGDISSIISNAFGKSIAAAFKDFSSAVNEIVDPFKKLGNLKPEQLKKGTEAIDVIFTSLGDTLTKTAVKSLSFLNFNIGKVGSAYKDLGAAVKDIQKPFESLSKMDKDVLKRGGKALSTILEAMGESIRATFNGTKWGWPKNIVSIGSTYKDFAQAIVDIQQPFIKLGSMKANNIENATNVVKGLFKGISDALVTSFKGTRIGFPSNISKIGTAYKDFATSIKDIVDPFKSLSTISAEKVSVGVGAINGILSGINDALRSTYSATTFRSWFSEDIVNIGTTYKDFAFAIKDIRAAYTALSGLSEAKIASGNAAITGILDGISKSIVGTFNGTTKDGKDLAELGSGYKDAADAISTLVRPIQVLSNIKKDRIESGIEAIKTILNGISEVIVSTFNGTASSGKDLSEVGNAFNGTAQAVSTIVKPIQTLSNLKAEKVDNAISTIRRVLVIFRDNLGKLSKDTIGVKSVTDVSSAFLTISQALDPIVNAITKFTKINKKEEVVNRAVTSIRKIIEAISGVLNKHSGFSALGVAASAGSISDGFVAISNSLTPIVDVIAKLSEVKAEPEKIKMAAESIAVVIESLSSVLGNSGNLFSYLTTGKVTDGFKEIVNSLAPIVTAITTLSMIKADSSRIKASADAIAIIIGSFSDVFDDNANLITFLNANTVSESFVRLSETLDPIVDSITKLAGAEFDSEKANESAKAIGSVIHSLGTALNDNANLLEVVTSSPVSEAFVEISKALSPITDAIIAVASIGSDSASIEAGATAIGIVISSIGKALNDNANLIEYVTSAPVGKAMAEMSGAISGISEAIVILGSAKVSETDTQNAISAIGEVLSLFSKILQDNSGFLDTFQSSTISSVGSSISAIGASLRDVAEPIAMLTKLGSNGANESQIDNAKNILISMIETISSVVKGISGFGSALRANTIAAIGPTFYKIAASLIPIQKAITTMAGVSGIPLDRMERVAEIMGIVIDTISSTLLGVRKGSAAPAIEALGDAFVKMCNSLDKIVKAILALSITPATTERINNATESLSDIIGSLGLILDIGALVSSSKQGNTIREIGNTFAKMCQALPFISKAIKGICDIKATPEEITNGTKAITTVVESLGKILIAVTGNTDSNGADQIEAIGNAFAKMVAALKDIELATEKIIKFTSNYPKKQVDTGVRALTDVIESVGGILSATSKYAGKNNAEAIEAIGTSFATMSNAIADIEDATERIIGFTSKFDTEQVANGVRALSTVIDAVGTALSESIDASTGVLYQTRADAITAIGNSFDTMAKATISISTAIGDLVKLGEDFDDAKITTASQAISRVVDALGMALGFSIDVSDGLLKAPKIEAIGNAFAKMAGSTKDISAAIGELATIGNTDPETLAAVQNSTKAIETITKALGETIFGAEWNGKGDMLAAGKIEATGTAYATMAAATKDISAAIASLAVIGATDEETLESVRNSTIAINEVTKALGETIFGSEWNGKGDWLAKGKIKATGEAFATMAAATKDISSAIDSLSAVGQLGDDKLESVRNSSLAITTVIDAMGAALANSTYASSGDIFGKGKIKAIGTTFAAMAEGTKNIADAIIALASINDPSLVTNAQEAITNVITPILETLQSNNFTSVLSYLSEAGSFVIIVNALSTVVSAIKELVEINDPSLVKSAQEAISDVINPILETLQNATFWKIFSYLSVASSFKTVAEALSSVVEAIKDLTGFDIPDREDFDKKLAIVEQLIDDFGTFLNENSSITELFGGGASSVGEGFASMSNSLPNLIRGIIDLITMPDISEAEFETKKEKVEKILEIFKQLMIDLRGGDPSGIGGIDVYNLGTGMSALISSLPELATAINADFDGALSALEAHDYASINAGIEGLCSELDTLSGYGNERKGKGPGIKNLASWLSDIKSALYGEEGGSILGGFDKDTKMEGLNEVADKLREITESCKDLTTQVANGINAGTNAVVSAIKGMLDRAKTSVDTYSKFKPLGVSIMDGMIDGVKSKSGELYDAIQGIVKEAYEKGKQAAQVNSPSKLFMKLGSSLSEGVGVGVEKGSHFAEDAVEGMVDDSFKALSDSIKNVSSLVEDEIGDVPVIRPVLDLSDVDSKVDTMASYFGDKTTNLVGKISYEKAKVSEAAEASASQNGSNNGENGASYSFVQNNYSPKALSRSEIYRQTKNQFSMLKGLANA